MNRNQTCPNYPFNSPKIKLNRWISSSDTLMNTTVFNSPQRGLTEQYGPWPGQPSYSDKLANTLHVGKRWFGTVLNTLLCVLALTGGLQLLAAMTSDSLVSPFRPLASFRPDLLPVREQVLTRTLRPTDSAEAHWEALSASRELLWAINPDILSWLRRMNKENRIIWEPRPNVFNWPVLAAYDARFDNLYLSPGFWELSEGEKAAVLTHEYFHAHQNRARLFIDTIEKALSGKLSKYGSRTEDEAHLYQLFAYRALGMPPSRLVRNYFLQRRLYRFTLGELSAPPANPS